MKNIKHLFMVAFAVVALGAQSQHMYPFRKFVDGGYNFWVYTPTNSADTVDKPLVVFLHGSSLCGNNLDRVRRYGPLNAIEMGMDIDALVLAPQNSGGAWKPDKIWKVVEWVEQHFAVDTNRIYVLGMSLGGYGTIDFTASYPSKIAAAMALCGGGNNRNLCPLNDVPLWILHGTADRAVGISQSQRVVDAISSCRDTANRLIWTRLKGMNHGQLVYAFYMPETYQWLFSHSLADDGRPVNRKFRLTPNNMNRNVYRSIRSESRVHVHSEPPEWMMAFRIVEADAAANNDYHATHKNIPAQASSKYYTIKKGDNLGSIARRHHTTVKKLCQLNGFNQNATLRVGRRIRVK